VSRIRIAVAGIGKIAHDQHLPTIAASDRFELAAAVTTHGALEGVPAYRTIDEMMAADPGIDAIALCTPPDSRRALLEQAFAAGLDVLIEKPPAATVSDAAAFLPIAQAAGRVMLASWHSRASAVVEPARRWIAGRRIERVDCLWKEDVRIWHPGQQWIWEPGIGVFDPGINAFSVLTHILPGALTLRRSELRFPENKAAPIAADIALDHDGIPVSVAFDMDRPGPHSWDIEVQAEDGHMRLSVSSCDLTIDGSRVEVGEETEYANLYRRFAELIERRECDVDLSPFHLVADAFMLGRRTIVAPFAEER
jgi:D-galactose 1-dehydrogenase